MELTYPGHWTSLGLSLLFPPLRDCIWYFEASLCIKSWDSNSLLLKSRLSGYSLIHTNPNLWVPFSIYSLHLPHPTLWHPALSLLTRWREGALLGLQGKRIHGWEGKEEKGSRILTTALALGTCYTCGENAINWRHTAEKVKRAKEKWSSSAAGVRPLSGPSHLSPTSPGLYLGLYRSGLISEMGPPHREGGTQLEVRVPLCSRKDIQENECS